jgi:D-aminoacyl-tRNA deacylase
MRVLLQRVRSSRVEVDGQVIGQIQRGLNLLVGIAHTDTEMELDWMVRKILELRVFPDATGRLAESVLEIQGELLVVSQFTLYGDCRKGRRTSFDRSAPGGIAETLFHQFVEKLAQSGLKVETGKFAAMMQVFIENDGPVTLMLEREAESKGELGG